MKKKVTFKGQLYYWFLKKSGIWRYWYEGFLGELMYDLELHRSFQPEEIEKKYYDKLLAFRKNKNF